MNGREDWRENGRGDGRDSKEGSQESLEGGKGGKIDVILLQ